MITTNDQPCWRITSPADDSDPADYDPHFATREAAEEFRLQSGIYDPESTSLVQVDAPCSTLSCDECGYEYDTEDEGVYHDDPENLISGSDWPTVDGKHYCLAEECMAAAIDAEEATR